MGEAITVVCRIRPLNQLERSKNSSVCLTFPAPNTVAIGGKTFTYDAVLQPSSTQLEVYERSAKSIVTSVLNGYNGTIFAYGQTASGKTYTMEGKLKDPEHKGIIPRIIEDIFLHIERMDENLEFLIKVSYFELYLEKIKDLLDITKTNLPIHESKDRVAYVKGATERFVSCADDVLDALDEGKINRHVSVTNMNEHSSRSHSMFVINIQQNNRETGKQLNGKLYLVDLAGSEKVSKTGAEGSTLDEAKMINKSLSTLGNVINALVEGNTHIPYRDSKLTRILQQSLGGNSKTTIIIAASPASFNETETKSTLVFGVRAKHIKNQVTLNAQLTADEWRRLFERESERSKTLAAAVNGLEAEVRRWRAGERVLKENWFGEEPYTKVVRELIAEASEPALLLTNPEISGRCSSSPASPGNFTGAISVPSPVIDAAKLKALRRAKEETTEEEKIQELFRLLDEKDDEINKQCQVASKLESQLIQVQAEYARSRREIDRLQGVLEKTQREADISRSEVKDVLQALEELAITYDDKATEAKKFAKEVEDLNSEIARLNAELERSETEMTEAKQSTAIMRERLHGALYNVFMDLVEVGAGISSNLHHTQLERTGTVEEQTAMLKLFVSQMKGEAQMIFKSAGDTNPDKTTYSSTELSELRREYDRKTKEVRVMLGESERTVKRREEDIARLELELQDVNKEFMRLKLSTALINELKQAEIVHQDVFNRLQLLVERHATHYQEQLERARGETVRAQAESDKQREETTLMRLQTERLMNEIELLRKRMENLEPTKSELPGFAKEQARNELKAMEDTVLHELQVLHTLRRMFIADLKNRIKKNSTKPMTIVEEEPLPLQSCGTAIQREKITFLKNSLDNLTKVHKQLVRDNSDLRCDIPKLEKRVKASMERIKDLELALRESKEQAIRDKKKYQHEIERIKEATWARGSARVRTNIAKPIRAGQSKE